LEGSRRRGRRTLRWLEDVEKDLREIKVKNWHQKPVDREEWASVIKGAKALRGSWIQGVSRQETFQMSMVCQSSEQG